MSRPFARGCVVVRGSRFGVVWADRGAAGLEILPLILSPTERHVHDVATNIPLPGAVIRPTPLMVSASGYQSAGTLPGETQCLVSQGVAKVYDDMMSVARWAGDRAHKQRARSAPVRLAV